MTYDPKPAASLLARHCQSDEVLTEVPENIRPQTLSEGYQVQNALIQHLAADVAGWKIAVGSQNAMKTAGISAPLFGQMPSSQIRSHGDTISVTQHATVTIEYEIALTLKRDILPNETILNPLDVVEKAYAVFEIVASRYQDREAVGWPSFVADNSAFHSLVVGSEMSLHTIEDVIQQAEVLCNQQLLGTTLEGDSSLNPLVSLQALIDFAKEQAITLKKDHIITTGTLTKPFNLQDKSNLLEANFLGLNLQATINLV